MQDLKKIVDWYNHFNQKILRVKSSTKELTVELEVNGLPHLLGLHYMYPKGKAPKGSELISNIDKGVLTYGNVFPSIDKAHHYKKSRYNSYVKNRIETFQNFMENLDKARIVEKTNKTSDIRSQYLAINTKDGLTRHLSILDIDNRNVLLNYDAHALESYLVQDNDNYYKDSSINEPIKDILFYDNEIKQFRPASFNIEKDNILKDCYLSDFKEKYQDKLYDMDFSKIGGFEYQNFNFIPLRELSKNERSMNLNEITSYLTTDGMFKNGIGKVDDIYNHINTNIDLFYNIETGNTYLPTNNGFMKYNIEDEEVITILENRKELENMVSYEDYIESGLYSEEQLNQIKDGFDSNIDVRKFANPNFEAYQMEEIKELIKENMELEREVNNDLGNEALIENSSSDTSYDDQDINREDDEDLEL